MLVDNKKYKYLFISNKDNKKNKFIDSFVNIVIFIYQFFFIVKNKIIVILYWL